uniref:Inosine-uridine preferring nucleoside hydrolase (EC) n=1 Tax=uncultured Thiotrichaceae bacterium TaxID=298394 RepID=A0A6S6TND6_9GAMM|nr:MAG: Inosine-uridine preferring nucleoside hydrolase (EC [uncultured Thiotrichaceae bacterium]
MSQSIRHKMIIDTDPGVDDAMAIFTAIAHPEIELLGLTTTFGNVSVERATQNALTLLEMSGLDIPVAGGVSVPEQKEPAPFPDFIHGADGFGNVNLPSPVRKAVDKDAADFIIETVMAHPGEVSLVAIGPLGNLALALEREPLIARNVKQVVIMGGSIAEGGNVSPVAEANIFSDPHAADKVMTAEWPLVMVGLDVTHQVLLTRGLFAEIKDRNQKVGAFMQQAATFYIDFYRREREAADGCFGHDVSAVIYVTNPDLFETQEGSIRVVPDGIAVGQTIMRRNQSRQYPVTAWDNQPVQKACMQVDSVGVVEVFSQAMSNDYWKT